MTNDSCYRHPWTEATHVARVTHSVYRICDACLPSFPTALPLPRRVDAPVR